MFLPFLSTVHLKLFQLSSTDGLLKSLNLAVIAKSKIDAKIPSYTSLINNFRRHLYRCEKSRENAATAWWSKYAILLQMCTKLQKIQL